MDSDLAVSSVESTSVKSTSIENVSIEKKHTEKPFVKKMLSAHSVVGLVVGAIMYLICLTGTLIVAAEWFERWEQPHISEYQSFPVENISTAVNRSLEKLEKKPESLFVVLPNPILPRVHVAVEENEWYVNADGSLSDPPVEGWTHLVRELHVSLHLPETVGVIFVGIIGAMLISLIISGVLAHPRIFKDAFKMRWGGNRRTEQVDLHNRLSVWGLPFHIMIAVTGAMFGLMSILVIIASNAFYNGDAEALVEEIYGADPVIDAAIQNIDFATGFENLKTVAPEATPIFVVVNRVGTRAQNYEIAATLPGRFAYSEMYRFYANGEYAGSQGLTEGAVSRQMVYSIYRLHFGHFGNSLVRLVYILLGFMLTVISVTGINIWLVRRGGRDWINDLWCGIVWGVPLALCVAANTLVMLGLSGLPVFIAVIVLAPLMAVYVKDPAKSKRLLMSGCAYLLVILLAGYMVRYPEHIYSAASLPVNFALVFLIFVLGRSILRLHLHQRKYVTSDVQP